LHVKRDVGNLSEALELYDSAKQYYDRVNDEERTGRINKGMAIIKKNRDYKEAMVLGKPAQTNGTDAFEGP
jgi:predicted secreted Zn-dependent protease